MTDLPTEILMQLVRARYTCLMQLRDLGRRQGELIDRGDVTGLLDLLSVKQKPLSDIQRIEKALDPYRRQDPERRQWRSADDRAACAELVRQCEMLLAEIVAREKECEELMVQKARRHGGPLAATPFGQPCPRRLHCGRCDDHQPDRPFTVRDAHEPIRHCH